MFSQSFSEHSLNLIVREQDRGHCLRTLRREFEVVVPAGQSAGPCVLGSTERVATVSVVGVSAWDGNGRGPAPARGSLASLAFGALGRCGTRVIAVAQAAGRPAAGRPAATEQAVSFCIPEEQMADTVRFLHRELGLEDER
jgi:aspartokinase